MKNIAYILEGKIGVSIKKRNKKRKKITAKLESILQLKKKIRAQEKNIYDLKQLLEISKSLNSVIEFSRLMEAILYVVMAQMKTFGVAIFIKNTFEDDNFVLYDDIYGFDIDDKQKFAIPESHDLIKFFAAKNSCVLPDEINTKFKKNKDKDEIIQMLVNLDASLFVPMKVKKRLVGFLVLGKQIEYKNSYDDYEQDMILSIANLAAIAINNAQLLEMSTTDMMTHLKFKHYFYAILSKKLETINKDSNLSVLMFDLDNFKKINDTYGHACGDIVLERTADIVKTSIRDKDLATRYGGEEFAVLLLDADIEVSKIIAERVRSRIEQMEIIYNGHPIKVTISVGIAQYMHNKETMKDLITRSDLALYESKRTGKNKYSISKQNLKAIEAEKVEDKAEF